MKSLHSSVLAALGLLAAACAAYAVSSTTVTVSSQTAPAPVGVNLWTNAPLTAWQMVFPVQINALVYLSAGASLTASVRITGDENPSPTGNWLDACPNITANMTCAIDSPITGIRLNVPTYASGTATMTVVQP